jgi:hypothetical protein
MDQIVWERIETDAVLSTGIRDSRGEGTIRIHLRVK